MRTMIANRVEQRSDSSRANELWSMVRTTWKKLITRIFDPYLPEMYYMRGPGRACKEKRASRTL